MRYDTPLQLFERWVLEDIEIGGVDGPARGRARRCCSAPPTTTRRCSPTRTGWTWPAPTTRTSPSAPASTSAWARRWPGSSSRRRSATLLRRLPDLELAAEPEWKPNYMIRGLEELCLRRLTAP